MNKTDFLEALKKGLKDYSSNEIAQYTDYYSEMIDDRIEEGLSEEEAVADVGTPEAAVAQIKTENPITNRKKERAPLKTWQIVLIAVGSPIWLSLLIAALSMVFSLFAIICSAIISLYAGAVSLAACGIAGVLALIPMLINANVAGGIMFVGIGLICAGLSIISFLGLNKLTKRLVSLLKNFFRWVQLRFFSKKEAVQ